MEFKTYINKKFLEYEHQCGGRKTITEFAEFLGVSQQSLSNWMNGTNAPSRQKSVELLASIFGPEVYDVIGKSSTVFHFDPLSEAPPEVKSKLSAALAHANQQYRAVADSGLRLSESEASRILAESMSRYGFSSKEISNSNPPE
ncbi:MAG: helix-turn-helix domain-containing protein [Anaerolineaceae bacterium]|nr:helix-turn-helix domain-containing protein [Anaerolineaceae bacterium]